MQFCTRYRPVVRAAMLALPLGLMGCGGGDDSPSDDNGSEPPSFSISGTITNLKRGDLIVSAAAGGESEALTFTESASFAFESRYDSGTEVALSITSQPQGQACTLSESNITISANTAITIECTDTEYVVSGSVSEVAPGNFQLIASGAIESTVELTAGEDFTLSDSLLFDQSVTLALGETPGYECSVAPAEVTINADITDIQVSCEAIEYSVSGLVTAAGPDTFELVLSGDRDDVVTLSPDSAFVIADDFTYNQAVSFAIDNAPGYDCEVTPAEIVITADIDDLSVACESKGAVSGIITNYLTGEVITDISVDVYRFDDGGEETLFATVTPDENGLFEAIGVDTGEEFYVRTVGSSYIVDVERLIANGDPERVVNLNLFPVDRTATFAITDAISLTRSDTAAVNIVEIDAGAVVTADGDAPEGEITARMVVIDPSLYVDAMPGLFTTESEDGELRPIESYGAFSFTMEDAAGNALNLADDTEATIRIPLPTGATSPPETIPLYYFDESTGLWVEEGSAELQTLDGNQFYVGTVNHFTTWNADQVYDTVQITGCVVDSDGEPLPYVRVYSEGQDYIGQSSAYTNVEGDFSLPAKMNASLLVYARASGQTNTVSVTTGDSDTNIENCLVIGDSTAIIELTWGANPRDLDSHLTGPIADTDDRFRVYFNNKRHSIDDIEINLDVDDVTSYGPEVITIPSFSLPGRYRYSVYHYAGSETIYASPTRVELRLDDRNYVFNPAEDANSRDSDFRMWVVFDLLVDDELNIEIVEINQHTSYSNADLLGVEGFRSRKLSGSEPEQLPPKKY